ncbi:MAG TPA: hypothetical protein VG845_08295 [Dehalococcoidia bacterium]|nr:hypothetical protein [Dehalococcoidia bacterium]
MKWLESFVLMEAMAAFVLASLNCRHLLVYARVARSAARRTGAGALCAVSAALALEALVYMASPALDTSPVREIGALIVRSGLLVASAAIAALLLRSAGRRV